MQRYSLPDPRFLPLGRHDPEEEKTSLWWSGSGVRVKIACGRLEADITSTAADRAPWVGVMMDGAPVARLPLLPGTHRYCLLAGLDGRALSLDESSVILLINTEGDTDPEHWREVVNA